MAIKRDAADKWFSACVRERANWTCEKSGLIDPEGQVNGVSRVLECAHVYGRRSRNVRWHPFNAFCLSHRWHKYFTENPIEFQRFVFEKLGELKHELLRERFHDLSIKYSPIERKKEIPTHYRKEYNKMREVRKCGVEGRIEFVGYD